MLRERLSSVYEKTRTFLKLLRYLWSMLSEGGTVKFSVESRANQSSPSEDIPVSESRRDGGRVSWSDSTYDSWKSGEPSSWEEPFLDKDRIVTSYDGAQLSQWATRSTDDYT